MNYEFCHYYEEGVWTIYRVGHYEDRLDFRKGSGKTIEIFDIAVNSERRKGIGKALVSYLVERVKNRTNLIFAIARSDNTIAKEFYEGIGFYIIADLPDFYPEGSAVIYGLRV